MARIIGNITDEPIQRHEILFDESEIVLTLRFYPRNQFWAFDVSYNGQSVNGIKLSCGVLHILSQNFPFDFIVNDLSGNGIDPFKRQDFSEERCQLIMLETIDMQDIRGVPVPL